MHYINAAEILPEPLLRELQKYWNGVLYVPAPKKEQPENEYEEIHAFILGGFPAKDVANICDVPLRKVYRIAQLLGKLNPYADPSRHLGGRPRKSPDSKSRNK